MTDSNESLLERSLRRIAAVCRENRLPLLSSLIAGLLAHMYVITNNLPNYDGVRYLFGKGETVGSGRWGLVLVQALIPNFTMPWLPGVVSLLLLAAAACLIVRMFAFKSPLAQILLPALILVFPSQIGNFSFMFVASSYALAFLLVVLAVLAARDLRGWRAWLCFVPTLVFALSIYQGYVSIAAGLLLLLLAFGGSAAHDLGDRGELLNLGLEVGIRHGFAIDLTHVIFGRHRTQGGLEGRRIDDERQEGQGDDDRDHHAEFYANIL